MAVLCAICQQEPKPFEDNKMVDRDKLASELFVALISNPERYKYIAKLMEEKGLSNDEATQKNIHKAYKLADQFIATSTSATPKMPGGKVTSS